ncbi:hypothetical protein N7462_008086 [Penicillium macrosclerotiorum]|uniref:uncharacterized protein n=1 Tax=Penicillium macrosclerotiorum TaxID=303699 RepID=UPI002549A51E|nr:uncharacterized protein N7462_008086 [Penicillium macrosclerotiorum]KAJ5679842.1 hypothetical protein N7462_008086 [Penicillium macrosclerotiorum]
MDQFLFAKDPGRHGCQIWDPDNASLSRCAQPYLVIAPAAVVLLISLQHWLGPMLRQWRPKWTIPFISEERDQQDLVIQETKQALRWTVLLLSFALIGLAAEIAHCIPRSIGVSATALIASWILVAIAIVAKRPTSCSLTMLAFFVLVFIVETVLSTADEEGMKAKAVSRYIAAGAALMACLTILMMPFRTSSLPVFDISAVGQAPSSNFRSPEDNLRLWQFLTVSWMAPLMSIGRKRQLHEPDVWLLGFEFQHRRLHEQFRRIRGSVLSRVLTANGLDVIIISAIAIVQMLCDFSTPVLLQQLLRAIQDPSKPKRVALTYAILSLVIRLVSSQSQVLNLWYGRRCYERSRGEMIMMIYEKALSRKNLIGLHIENEQQKPTDEEDISDNNIAAEEDEAHSSKPSFLSCLFHRSSGKPKIKPSKPKEAASLGKIFNLLRGDVYDVAQRFWEIDRLIDQPLGLIIAVVLVWVLFGPSCFLGILAVLVAQVLNALITRILLRRERVTRAATDTRLQTTSQFVEAIRHLRWYGWQNQWLKQVMDARQTELNRRIVTSLWSTLIQFVNSFTSGAFPVVALYAYTMLAGHELRIDIIFPALQLFTMLETRLREVPGLITVLINSSIALSRIEDFMMEPDKTSIPLNGSIDDSTFRLESCSFAWPGKKKGVLTDINVTIPKGLTVVTGKVGAGKTALLQSLLGELDKLGGTAHIPNEMVGYCAQTPWLQSMSIRENILFSAPYEEHRYKQTLEACALLPDLSQFKHGDLTFIGENGVGLSGGQKARVALARAVYSTSRVLLLDDPLSALDHNTAEFVVRKCLSGPLTRGRTTVLVTHRTALIRDIADQIIQIDEGHATVYGKSSIPAIIQQSDVGPALGLHSPEAGGEQVTIEDEETAVPDKFIEDEYRAEWGVQSRVYWSYIKSAKYRWWILLVFVLAIFRLTAVGQSWFLKGWAEAYDQKPVAYNGISVWKGLSQDTLMISVSNAGTQLSPNNPMIKLPPPNEDVRPWLWAFFAIVSFQAIALVVSQLIMLIIVYTAGKTLFRRVMARVSNATFRFFDITPVGRLMNRLTSDIGVVDGNISMQFQAIAFHAITWISSILVIATATPIFLAFSLALTMAFVTIFLHFLPTSQSLRRLEMVSLSPLLSNFGELLHGLTTVRAFHAEGRFQSRVISVVDKFQGMDHFYWSLQAWLTYRFENLSAFSTFCLTILALYTNTTPGLVAFVLIAANNLVSSTHALCKQYGQLQMDFVSVERVDELLHIEEEPCGTVDPPAAWPKYGSDITFEDVTIRYAPHLDPALKDVSFKIPGGSTTAIIGRTGSGKSTLAVSLLRVIQPEMGHITIDGINIADVNTQALRTRVTFVAQDPVLFPGSIRLNLDPTQEFTDQQCADLLARLCGRHGWSLDTTIEAGGKNLSQGQRQLIALTRSVLRRSSVVIFDEATASIDHETSLEIQQIVREELRLSTVITIAHRIEAVNGADYFVVLDQGRVSRHGYVCDL